jgi:hypothetical protein
VAEVLTRAAGGPRARRRNRRQKLEAALREAKNSRQVLAAAAQYFRSTFIREDEQTVQRVTRLLIELTDREAGENR